MKTCLVRGLILLGVVLAAGMIALFALSPLDREYALRIVRWGVSDVKDYQRFPERVIEKPAQADLLPVDLHPEWFTTIQYTAGGKTYQSSVDDLMTKIRTQALIVIQDDQVVYEKYYNGYQRDSIVTSFSSAKSFNSALIGIAIDEGLIGSVNDPILRYLPELAGRGRDEMTLRDLLMMSSGIRYVEDEHLFPLLGAPFSDDAKSYYYPDLRGLALDVVRHGDEPIGANMHYNNYHPILEGMILERVTGMTVAKYLETRIWQKVGAEYPASWSLDSQATGFEKMESGINARAMDFARLGLLFLREGNWQGEQVISPAWVKESSPPAPNDQRGWPYWPEYREGGGYYKYHWWGNVRADGHYDYTAAGNFGQYIYVCQQKNLVIVRYGENDEPVDSFRDVLYALEQMVPQD
ncbi:MAG TPA: serine hydrolase [Anaerolinea sp.]|nr:serine hydrolase [Anaerolinea sp.]